MSKRPIAWHLIAEFMSTFGREDLMVSIDDKCGGAVTVACKDQGGHNPQVLVDFGDGAMRLWGLKEFESFKKMTDILNCCAVVMEEALAERKQ